MCMIMGETLDARTLPSVSFTLHSVRPFVRRIWIEVNGVPLKSLSVELTFYPRDKPDFVFKGARKNYNGHTFVSDYYDYLAMENNPQCTIQGR